MMNVLSSILSKRAGCSLGIASAFSFLVAMPLHATTPSKIPSGFGQIPLHFEQNRGQAGEGIDFTARGNGYGVALTPAGADIGLRGNKGEAPAVIRMRLAGAVSKSNAEALEKLPGVVNYRIGNDQSRWQNGIETYGKVRYPEVYSGVDLVYYGNQRQLQYDFIVAPGGDPGLIGWKIDGVEGLAIGKHGELILSLKRGELVMKKPFIYQTEAGSIKAIEGGFEITDGTVGFKIGSFDRTKPLVIDPVLEYSTYLGGDIHDGAKAVAVDSQGNVYVVGCTYSTTFPTSSNAIDSSNQGIGDAFISKLDPSGTTLLYSTYLGGDGFDYASAVAVDSARNIYVTGETYSSNFFLENSPALVGSVPLGTVSIYADSPAGSTTVVDVSTVDGAKLTPKFNVSQSGGFTLSRTGDVSKNLDIDLEVTVFLSDGSQTTAKKHASIPAGFKSRTWATDVSIKSNGTESPVYTTESRVKVVADTSGNDYLIDAHDTANIFFSASFPVAGSGDVNSIPSFDGTAILSIAAVEPTVGEIPGNPADGYPQAAIFRIFREGDVSSPGECLVRFNTSASPGNAVENDDYQVSVRSYDFSGVGTDTAYVGGSTITIPAGVSFIDLVVTPKTDGNQERTEPVVALLSSTTDWVWAREETIRLVDTNGGDSEGFLAKINADSGALDYLLQFGGGGIDIPNAVAVDLAGNLYVAGETYSWNFPSTGNAVRVFPPSAPAASDAFVLKLSGTTPTVRYSTLHGGDGQDAAYGIAADSTGAAYITGFTASKAGAGAKSAFPTLPISSAIQKESGGDYDAFVAKIDSLGRNLIYSTFLGGDGYDSGKAIAVDLVGNAYVTGETRSSTGGSAVVGSLEVNANLKPFPTRNAFQTYNLIPPNPADGSVEADEAANSMSNAFVSKINPIGTVLLYSTYLGGSSNDYANGIAVDVQGNAYITGYTESPDLPMALAFSGTSASRGLFTRSLDAFIAVLQPDGSRIRSTTYLGGDGPDFGLGMALDRTQPLKPEAILVGETYSNTFPTTAGALQTSRESAPSGFVSKISFPQPDLAVTATFSPVSGTTAKVGEELTLKVTVKNNSSFVAAGVRVNQTLPGTVAYVSTDAPYLKNSAQNPLLLEGDMGLLAAGASKSFRVNVRPKMPGLMASTVSVNSDSYDPIPGNNFKQIDFTVEASENGGVGSNAIAISVVDGHAHEYRADTGTVRVTRTGDLTNPLTVRLNVGGSATNGTDYKKIPLRVVIPAGASSADVIVTPILQVAREGAETVILSIRPDLAYSIKGTNKATVTIRDYGDPIW